MRSRWPGTSRRSRSRTGNWPSLRVRRALAHSGRAFTTKPVIEAARAAVAALGIENGPSYTQIRLGPDGRAYVVEVAARLGGGHDAELCRAATASTSTISPSPLRSASRSTQVAQSHTRCLLSAARAWSSSSRRRGRCSRRRASKRPRLSMESSGSGCTADAGGGSRASVVARIVPVPSWRRAATGGSARAGSPCGGDRTLGVDAAPA